MKTTMLILFALGASTAMACVPGDDVWTGTIGTPRPVTCCARHGLAATEQDDITLWCHPGSRRSLRASADGTGALCRVGPHLRRPGKNGPRQRGCCPMAVAAVAGDIAAVTGSAMCRKRTIAVDLHGPPPRCNGDACSRCNDVCPSDPMKLNQPKQICLTTPLPDPVTNSNGSDLDTGYTGISHNFPVVAGSTVRYCLSNCDGSSDTTCDGVGTTGPDSQNGETFGAPLALFSGGVPVCVVNRYQPGDLTGTFDLSSGVSGDPTPNAINLFSDTYLRFGLNGEVCPRCNVPNVTGADAIGQSGTCSDSSRTPGAPCTVNGFMHLANQTTGNADYTLSSSCIPPSDANNPTTLNIPLRLTTGTATSTPGPNPCAAVGQNEDDNCGNGSCSASCTNCLGKGPNDECVDPKGGIAQLCCSGNTDAQTGSCFPTKNGGTITRQGRPAAGLGSGSATGPNGVLFATTFCIPPTKSSLINATAGLPGPGALLLPSDVQVLTHRAQ